MEKTGVTILKSLVKNASVIDGARHKKWFIAIIMAFISLVLSLIPTFVTTINTSGQQFIKGTTYGLDTALVAFANSTQATEFEIKLDDKNKKYLDVPANTELLYTHSHIEDVYDDTTKQMLEEPVIDFVVYSLNTDSSKTFNQFRNNVVKGKVNPLNVEEEAIPALTFKSTMIISKTQLYVVIFAKLKSVSSFKGDFTSFKVGYKLSDIADVEAGEQEFNNTFKNWCSFFNKAYETTKKNTVITNTLVLLGVNAVIMIFMGLIMFILCRGKTNPFRIYTFWDTQKMAYWASISPAVLSVAIGFMLPQFASMAFVFLFGIRCMFMSMKYLRVTPQAE